MSAEGLKKLREELHDLKTRGRSEAAAAIAEAREKGDLSENAEYDAAKEAQGLLEKKIAEMEGTVSRARVIDTSKLDTSKVTLMARVRIKNLKVGKEFTYQIVSESEADLKQKKISVKSPIAEALLGKKVGDTAEAKTPGGIIGFEILSIDFD